MVLYAGDNHPQPRICIRTCHSACGICGQHPFGGAHICGVFLGGDIHGAFFSSLLPRRIPYALRIILYTAAAAAVYIPFYIYFDGRLPADAAKLGMFLPMIATSQFVVSASELRFFRMSRPQMMADVISHIIGLDIAIIFMGAVRELFSTGGINGALYGITYVNPLIGAPCGGFIMIGLMGALIRLCSKK